MVLSFLILSYDAFKDKCIKINCFLAISSLSSLSSSSFHTNTQLDLTLVVVVSLFVVVISLFIVVVSLFVVVVSLFVVLVFLFVVVFSSFVVVVSLFVIIVEEEGPFMKTFDSFNLCSYWKTWKAYIFS